MFIKQYLMGKLLKKMAINQKKFIGLGTPAHGGHFVNVTAETPPPVQAAGDTIPKGLRSTERRPFFQAPAWPWRPFAQCEKWLKGAAQLAEQTHADGLAVFLERRDQRAGIVRLGEH
jgi:hypothetical protein